MRLLQFEDRYMAWVLGSAFYGWDSSMLFLFRQIMLIFNSLAFWFLQDILYCIIPHVHEIRRGPYESTHGIPSCYRQPRNGLFDRFPPLTLLFISDVIPLCIFPVVYPRRVSRRGRCCTRRMRSCPLNPACFFKSHFILCAGNGRASSTWFRACVYGARHDPQPQ